MLLELIKAAITKEAASKLNAITKSIPLSNSQSNKKLDKISPPKQPKATAPSSLSGMDLMAPPTNPQGNMKTPGMAYVDNMVSAPAPALVTELKAVNAGS